MKLPELTLATDANAAIGLLDQAGWVEIGRGDWSWVYAAPAGDVAIRLSPWDSAYALHVRLCTDNPGNPYLQRIHRVDPLGRVGSAVWMQRLQAADDDRAIAFCHALGFGSASNPAWLQQRPATPWPDDDMHLRELRVLLAAAMAIGQRSLPLWGGSDMSPKNILAGPQRSAEAHRSVLRSRPRHRRGTAATRRNGPCRLSGGRVAGVSADPGVRTWPGAHRPAAGCR